MSYCSIDDITSRMPIDTVKKLTQDDRASSEINRKVVDIAISDATAIIDNKIGQRYALPLPTVPGILKRISVDIAIYFIYRNRFDNKVPEEVKSTFTESVEVLSNIEKGISNLDGVAERNKTNFVVRTNHSKSSIAFTAESLRSL